MGETVKIRKLRGTFPETVAGANGYKAEFNEKGVASVDPVHALHFLQFHNDYQVAKADADKLPPFSAYQNLMAKPAPKAAPAPVAQANTEDFINVPGSVPQPENFDDEEDFFVEGDAIPPEGSEEDNEFTQFNDGDGDTNGTPDGFNDDDSVNPPANPSQEPAEAFICNGCSKEFGSKAGLNTHMRSCAALKPVVPVVSVLKPLPQAQQ